MAEIDSGTLVVAIQALEVYIQKNEELFENNYLGNREDLEEYIFTLYRAKEVMKESYLREKKVIINLPEYDDLIKVF